MARVLILRQEAEARETAEALRALGHVGLILPLQAIVPLDPPIPKGEFCAILVTSRQAVPAVAERFAGDSRPVLAVGHETARALEAAGCADVVCGDGTAASLIAEARGLFAQDRRPLLYAAGRIRTPDLETALRADGIPVLAWEVYDTQALAPSQDDLDHALDGMAPDAVLVLSVGQAIALARLIETNVSYFRPMPRLLCLSARIADALPAALRPLATISPRQGLTSLFELCH